MQAEIKQTRLVDPILAEIDPEAEITKRLLNIIPEDKLTWRPHPKAMSLGQLALHIAMTQGETAEATLNDAVDVPDFVHPEAQTRDEILTGFDSSVKKAKEIVSATSDERALEEWKVVNGDRVVFAMPRMAVWRIVMMNQLYHHRGQLSTYLRTLDVPLPSIYGPSADTNPFA